MLLGPTHRMPVRGDRRSTPPTPGRRRWAPWPSTAPARDAIARTPNVAVDPQPFDGEHGLEVHLPFIQRALGEVEVLPMLVGQPAPGQVSAILDQLWGGPETAIVISSDLTTSTTTPPRGPRTRRPRVGIERLQGAVCEGHRACGYTGIAGLIDQAQRRDLRVTALDVRNSGDTQGDPSRVVGYGSFAFEYAHTARVDAHGRRMLFDLAREVVRQAALHDGKAPQLNINGALPPPAAPLSAPPSSP